MAKVTQQQLESALADLASGGNADAVAERLRADGVVGWRNACMTCPVAVWLTRRLGAWVEVSRFTALTELWQVEMPRPVQEFIGAFDWRNGHPYADLVGDPHPLLAAIPRDDEDPGEEAYRDHTDIASA
jgi:hypothetical protein